MRQPEIPSNPNNAGQQNSPSQQQHRQARIAQLLLDISQSLNRNLNTREALDAGLNALAQETEMTHGTIAVVQRETGDFEIKLAYGQCPEDSRCFCEAITRKVIERESPAIIQEAPRGITFLEDIREILSDSSGKIGHSIFICVPLHDAGGEIIGALGADKLFPTGATPEEELQLLSDLAGLFAQAVNIRLEAAERERVLREERDFLQSENLNHFNPGNIVGNSHAIRQVCHLIHQVAPSNVCVLITGEGGTGKELAAEAIHINSPRAGKPFIRASLASIPENMIESEMFGFKRSPLTGAVSIHKGLLEMANEGTLFLDEISHLPMSMQVRLLRVLQEKEFDRPGSNEPVHVDVRILSSTKRNLEELIQKFQFRMDLYYRLNLVPIYIPPLRERKTDILALTEHFISHAEEKHGKHVSRISSCAIDLMMQYHWPGNIRELENCIERAVLLTTNGVIYGHHLPLVLQTADDKNMFAQSRLEASLAALEREMIVDALRTARGNGTRAAQALGISERLIRLRIAKYRIDPKQYKRMPKSQQNDRSSMNTRTPKKRNASDEWEISEDTGSKKLHL
jgi:Nif-specific regulatory protein